MITKTTMRRWLAPAVVIGALGTLVVADTAWAQLPGGPGARDGRMGRRPGPPPGGPMMHLRAVNLSQAQQDQIRSIHEQSGEAVQAVEARVRTARQALQHAVTADGVNEGAIRAAASDLGIAEGDAAVQRAYLHAQVWQMLTPEQRVSARDAEDEMERRMAQRQQRMSEHRELGTGGRN